MSAPSTQADNRGLTRRAVLAGVAIAFISLAFIGSYVGALHASTPHKIPIAVADQVPAQLAARLNRSAALRVDRVAGPAAALTAIDRRNDYGAITASARGFTVTTAPAASVIIADLLAATLPGQLRATGAPIRLAVVHVLPASDVRGLVGFYTVVGFVIAGYLGATFFGLVFGTEIGRLRTVSRLSALSCLGLVIGLGGTLLAKGIGGLPAPWLEMTLIGALAILAAGSVTVALQSALGVYGTALAILIFVIVGNPSSGGPAAPELLPGFWRAIGQLVPVGAGVTAVRNMSYFPDASIGGPVLVLLLWALAGVIVALLLSERSRPTSEVEAEVAAIGMIGA
jgi:hypothetical protein